MAVLVVIIVLMVVANIEETVGTQPVWLMDLKTKIDVPHKIVL